MIVKLSEKIALSIKNANPQHTASIDVMKYALIHVINGFAVMLFSLLIGLFTGRFLDTLLALLSFAILRSISGGMHLGTAQKCVLLSTILITLIVQVPINHTVMNIMTVFSIIMVVLLAPRNLHRQNKFSDKLYPMFKLLSLLMVSSNIFIGSFILAKVFFVQATLLLSFKK